jgi:hypothetical protein
MKPHIKRVQVGSTWVWQCKSENIRAWCKSPATVWEEWRKAVKAQLWLNSETQSFKTVSNFEIALAHGGKR